MKRLKFVIACLALLVSGCLSEYGNVTVATPVQLAEVIRDPSRWNDKIIQIEGVFNFELEGDAIYLSKKDLEERNLKNSIGLVLDNPELAIPYGQNASSTWWRKIFVPLSLRIHIGKQAVVTGMFKTQSFGGLSSGTMYVNNLILK